MIKFNLHLFPFFITVRKWKINQSFAASFIKPNLSGKNAYSMRLYNFIHNESFISKWSYIEERHFFTEWVVVRARMTKVRVNISPSGKTDTDRSG